MSVLVAVLTRDRPGMLERCLCSLAASDLPDETQVLVIDDGSAAPARAAIDASVHRWRATLPLSLLDGPGRGVAAARNLALETALASQARAIVFLDDDQTAPPGFVPALIDTWAATGADVVKPQVLWAFEPPARHMDAHAREPGDGPDLAVTTDPVSTNGVLIGRRVFDAMGLRFDTGANMGLGEDTLFFRKALAGGARIVLTRSTYVVEYCPARKQTVRWLLARSWSVGLAEVTLGLKPYGRIRLVTSGILCALLHGMLTALARPSRRLYRAMRAAKCAGRVAGALGLESRAYRRVVGH